MLAASRLEVAPIVESDSNLLREMPRHFTNICILTKKQAQCHSNPLSPIYQFNLTPEIAKGFSKAQLLF